MSTHVGQIQRHYFSAGRITFQVELWHDELNKHRVIKGPEIGVVQRKAVLQAQGWDERWLRSLDAEETRRSKVRDREILGSKKQTAVERTEAVEMELGQLEEILHATLAVDDTVDWEQLKDTSDFPTPPPEMEPPKQNLPKPGPDDPIYAPKLGLFDRVISSRRERVLADSAARYEADSDAWLKYSEKTSRENAEAGARYAERLVDWEAKRSEFLQQQAERNDAVDRQRQAYESGSAAAIIEYADLVLSNSSYLDYFPQEFELDYNADNRMLVVEYALPAPDDLPRLKSVKYVASRDELSEQFMPDSQSRKQYDSVLYKLALRTVHELFEADAIDVIDAIVFNGLVTSIDQTTGKKVTACVLSLQVTKTEFEEIDLAHVEPRACFKALKGVGSSKLHSLAAVAPIMQMRRDDGRFVSAQEVANTLDESSNLAAMDWEDFEHLIRELFEQEFKSSGGEVKVTQASRDGGVDTIAFDPDPIRGGEIVIQAKRYTNTVGVSAVRDLYGTVMNEGATKGVLVTTSDFGPDAYGFAKDKPLALLNGGNLLHMLQKHGHKVRIDIQEARRAAGRS
jgi:restriction system protein